jgi:hypothetical protein
MNMQKFNREPILKFDQYFQTQRLSSFSLKSVQYIPIAESILANDNIYLETEQKSVLEFIVERQIPIDKWILLKEDFYTDAINYIQTNYVEPSTKAIKGAINWVVELSSDLISAIGSVVDKIMEGVQTAWDSVKIETNKWFAGNRSLKRQMTISINQQISSIKESLNEDEDNSFVWETLTKETGQLSNMFVETIGKVINGDVFASKVTMSINKLVNESQDQNPIHNNIKENLLSLLPEAISQNVLDVNKHSKFNLNNIKIPNFKDMKRLDESIKMIDDFYKWCVEKLNNLPPFSWITQFAEHVKNNGNEALEYSSKFLTEHFGVNGPFEFETLGPTFAILINALSDFGKYILIDTIIASISNIIIPGSGPIVMFLLNIYAFWLLAEVIYDLISEHSEEDLASQN